MEVKKIYARVLSTKGQVTIPLPVRQLLSLEEGDVVSFELKENMAVLKPLKLSLEEAYGAVKPIKKSFSEQRRLARQERVQK